MKTSVKVQRTFDLLEVSEDNLRLIVNALGEYLDRAHYSSEGEQLKDDLMSLLLDEPKKAEQVKANEPITMDTVRKWMYKLNPLGLVFVPRELMPKEIHSWLTAGTYKFIYGNSGQVAIQYFEETENIEIYKPVKTIWLNKACVDMVYAMIRSKGTNACGLIPISSGYEKYVEAYKETTGKKSYSKQLRITYDTHADLIAIEKEHNQVILSALETVCLEEFLKFHLEGDV